MQVPPYTRQLRLRSWALLAIVGTSLALFASLSCSHATTGDEQGREASRPGSSASSGPEQGPWPGVSRAATIMAVQRAADSSYDFKPGETVRAHNRAHGFELRCDDRGPELTGVRDDWQLRLRLIGWGRGTAWRAAATTTGWRAERNRMTKADAQLAFVGAAQGVVSRAGTGSKASVKATRTVSN